jgi:hypothetical protein
MHGRGRPKSLEGGPVGLIGCARREPNGRSCGSGCRPRQPFCGRRSQGHGIAFTHNRRAGAARQISSAELGDRNLDVVVFGKGQRWIGGADGLIMMSTDGGNSWTASRSSTRPRKFVHSDPTSAPPRCRLCHGNGVRSKLANTPSFSLFGSGIGIARRKAAETRQQG